MEFSSNITYVGFNLGTTFVNSVVFFSINFKIILVSMFLKVSKCLAVKSAEKFSLDHEREFTGIIKLP